MKKMITTLLILITAQVQAYEYTVVADDQQMQTLIDKRPVQQRCVQNRVSYSYREKLAVAVMKSFADQVFAKLSKNSIESNSTYRAQGITIKRQFKKSHNGQVSESLTLIYGDVFWKVYNGQWKSSPVAYGEITEVYKVLQKQGFSAGKLEIVAASVEEYRQAMRLIKEMGVDGLAGYKLDGRPRVILRK